MSLNSRHSNSNQILKPQSYVINDYDNSDEPLIQDYNADNFLQKT